MFTTWLSLGLWLLQQTWLGLGFWLLKQTWLGLGVVFRSDALGQPGQPGQPGQLGQLVHEIWASEARWSMR